MGEAYVTNITHFLDEAGELRADMPGPARKLASFLVLLIDAVSQRVPARDAATGIRCRTTQCTGSIRASLMSPDDEVAWRCPVCGHNGTIRNWQGTKWDEHSDGPQPPH